MEKQRIDLRLALSDDLAACRSCAERIVRYVQDRPGILEAHVRDEASEAPMLCLHYDPAVLRLEELRALVSAAGAVLRSDFEHLAAPAVGLRHERQARLVEGALARVPGVLSASVSFGGERMVVEYDPAAVTRDAILRAAEALGVSMRSPTPTAGRGEGPVSDHGHAHANAHGGGSRADHGHDHDHERGHEHEAGGGHDHDHGGPFGERSELVFSLGCGLLTGVGWVLERRGAPGAASNGAFAVAYALGSWFTLQEVAVALKARRFEIDFLMLLAAAGAAFLGNGFEGALLLALFTFGHALEGFAMKRARNAIAALAALVPPAALRLDERGGEEEVLVGQLTLGDRVIVRPNTKIPADGFVLEGASSVDQAPITGESVPVDKRPVADLDAALRRPEALAPEHRAFAGTINGSAALTIVVTKVASESTLARAAKLVAEAGTQKSPTQQFTDRFERVFVPLVLALVVALHFAWLVLDEPFAASFYRAMAVLVAASPCALAIATPSAVLAGVARAARAGVLVKGGAHLEALGQVEAIAFDKTGTLTEGKPKLTDVEPAEGVTASELLAIAWAVEKRSDHPLARAIVVGAAERLGDGALQVEATSVEAIVGYGVRARVGEREVHIGKPGLFTREAPLAQGVAAIVARLEEAGRTLMLVRAGDRMLGVLGVMDTPRASARAVVAELHALGVARTIMLTGDNERVASVVGTAVGIREVRGDLLPEQKVEAVATLARSSSCVAMVGDGVNDAPAMATATVGIAMGAGGSDVALETADVALMADDLRALPFAVALSRAARRIILQNLWASLGMVALLIPATLFGVAKIGVAVALHEGFTLIVVANALRLLAFEAPTRAR